MEHNLIIKILNEMTPNLKRKLELIHDGGVTRDEIPPRTYGWFRKHALVINQSGELKLSNIGKELYRYMKGIKNV